MSTTTSETATAEIRQQPDDEIETLSAKEEVTEPLLSRSRKMTAKGIEYARKVKMKRPEQLSRAADKSSDVCMNIMDSEDGSVKELRKKHKHWLNLFEKFLTTDLEYRPLLSLEYLENYLGDWYEERHYVFKKTIEDWFSRMNIVDHEQLNGDTSTDSDFTKTKLSSLPNVAFSRRRKGDFLLDKQVIVASRKSKNYSLNYWKKS